MKELGTNRHERHSPEGVKLLGNFIRSYKDSQGNPSLQQMLLLDVSRQQSGLEISPAEVESLTETVCSLSLPSNHTLVYPESGRQITPEVIIDEFRTMWRAYIRVLGGSIPIQYAAESELAESLAHLNEKPSEELLTLIGSHMCQEDHEYVVERGRDKSYIRDHAFAKISTGSIEFNNIYGRVAGWIEDYGLLSDSPAEEIPGLLSTIRVWKVSSEISTVKEVWEEHHPGESFIPQAI